MLATHFPVELSGLPVHFITNGGYGVTFFFVVSGYLITGMLANGRTGLFEPNLRDFYVRRLARILPLVLVSLPVGAYAMGRASNYDCFRVPGTHYGVLFWLSILSFTFNWMLFFKQLLVSIW